MNAPVVLRDNNFHLGIDPHVHFIIDSQNVLTPGAIGSLNEQQWAQRPFLPLNAGYMQNPVWVRISIENSSKKGHQLYLSLTQPQLDTVELYRLELSQAKLLARTGWLCRYYWPGVADRKPTFFLPVDDTGGKATFFLRIKTSDVCAISLHISESGYFLRSKVRSEIYYGIYFGALGAIALFNLFLFMWVRFSSCFWYTLWILSMVLFQFSLSGHWNLVDGEPLWFTQRAIQIFAGSGIIAAAMFSILFLRLREFNIPLQRIFLFYCGSGLLLMLSSLLGAGRVAAIGTNVIVGSFSIICLGTGIATIKARGRPAVFYSVALLLMMCGILLTVGKNFGVLPNISLTAHSILLASVMEAGILALALVDRISTIQKEKASAHEKSKFSELMASESRLRALQTQINPHFLFNSFNMIAETISVCPKKAETLVIHLSRLFRYALSASKRKNVPLSEEIEMIKTYLLIEKERFGKRLEYAVDVYGDPSKVNIKGLLIQPIVENAVKHGIGPVPGGGRIDVVCRIENQTVYFKIRDSGGGFGHSTIGDGEKTGVENVKERLFLSYGNAATLSCVNDNGAVVEISIPTGVCS